ncbi:zinc finger protein [Seiridium cupressi]
MTGNFEQAFDNAIKEFKEGLGRRDLEDFRTTIFEHLKANIANLQVRQHSQRRLQDLSRLQPFLEAVDQYSKVVVSFYLNDDTVAFVWGPVKYLLQTTSVSDVAFNEFLDAYRRMGENLPLLLQYQDLFRAKPHMVRVLALIYEDVLKFQRIILRYFQQPQWQRVFSESWDTCKSRFSSIIRTIALRRSLIESQATPSQIEEDRRTVQQSRKSESHEFDEQNLRQIRDVYNWLRSTNVEIDQITFIKARADYPGTGQWLLENMLFKEWFDPRFPTIPPLLWLSGIPGAGKTILASFVVEKARELHPTPAVLYFYCKHDNPERDNFLALGRSLLAQFLKHDIGLLPSFCQKSCHSGEMVLSSSALVEELLDLAFGNCKSAYIILDGLDECPRDQRKIITQWFRKLIENLPSNEPERLRCLFVSQDDGPARKDFAGLASIKIRAEDNQHDVEEHSRVEADLLASLVETRSDGTIEFVHLTAKFFLLEEKLVIPSIEELKLANLCIDYLNLPALVDPPTVKGLLNGDYGFMEYAVLYWLRHLELGATLDTDGVEELKDELMRQLQGEATRSQFDIIVNLTERSFPSVGILARGEEPWERLGDPLEQASDTYEHLAEHLHFKVPNDPAYPTPAGKLN